ncbi:MAG: cupin domain-containing protein [Desulfobacterales bacterium]|nr:cupin domain-containing protein [Desulfobacterales bacterium]
MGTNEFWVICDLRNDHFFELSLKVISKAYELSRLVSGKTAAILFAPVHDNELNKKIERCINHGGDLIYVITNSAFDSYRADIYSEALFKLVLNKSPKIVMFSLSDFSKELSAIVARRNNSGLIAHCVDFKIKDEKIIASCPSWGGEVMAEITYSNNVSTSFATVLSHELKSVEVKGVPGTIQKIDIDLNLTSKIKLLSHDAETKCHRLEDSEIVVVGGAGLGSLEGFGLARDLSRSLGAEIASTRPPILNHWVEEERLIGQTGKNIKPNLLFSIGTSGAIQYTAGIIGSKNIVAINRDRNSPIFQIADIGIVCDAKIFLPILTNKINELTMRKLTTAICQDKTSKLEHGIGAKIRKIRESHNLTIEDLCQATNQSPEFINQVENDEIIPSVGFVLRLSRALKVDPSAFLRDEEKNMIRDQRIEAFTRRTKNYSYQTLTPGAANEHLRAFMIAIEPMQSHKPVAYKHEGEEFIFVTEGDLELTLGNKPHHLKQGESIHFNSEIPHKLQSLSDADTKCIVVLYTP